MNDWIQKQFANDFADLKGLSITAQIPVKDRLVNELLTGLLQGVPANTPPAGGIEVRRLLKYVERAEVHASDGVIAFDVVIKI
jgi:hypothetical protein